MDFVVGDIVRQGFGFANPNHAAAAICALFPFCWGWGGKWRWAGWLVGVALCVMLAMTYSRTGMAVLAIEAVVLWQCGALGTARPTSGRGRVRARVPTMSIAVAVAAIALWWMWPRLALDGAVESAGRYARLIVSDTGRGIPRAEQKSVFRRFYRASNAGDRVGSGLGLATVREIVESRYGGKVSLSSTPGRGSTFTVTFPRRL